MLVLGIAYALVAAAAQPFSWQANVVTAIPVAALAAGAIVRWPRHPTRTPPPRPGHPYLPWLAVSAAVVAWELFDALLPGTRGNHPTFSSMLNAVDRHYGLKVLVFFAWLSLGWVVVRVGRPAQR